MKKLITVFAVVLMGSPLMAQDNRVKELENEVERLDSLNSDLQTRHDSLFVELTMLKLDMKLDSLWATVSSEPQSGLQEDGSYYVTEDRALDIIKDDYEFYNRNYVYRGVKLRRKEANEFLVSLEECHKEMLKYDSWTAKVKTLTVNEDGTFTFY